MSARKLHVSPQLALPPDTVTSTLIVYGGKGMGKTNFGSVLVEECAAAGLRFSVLDPMGVWWGLRHSADGKGPGIEVLILGGIHGDIPIEPTGGAVVADLVVDEDANVVIDISRRPDGTMWSIGERVKFVRDYCKRLYQRQGEKRRPLLQALDEAARFIPQIIRQGEVEVAACMGAIAVLVEEGRNVGVGVCLITQRSARLNKDVAELADVMIAFRTVGPNSRRAVMDWLGEHVEKDRVKQLDVAVRSLPRGSALVVSPGWLEYEGIVPMRMRTTFDSSATPKAGEERRASGPGAKPDLAKYQQRMAATIEKAKADDPKELRKRITELEREVAKKRPAPAVRVEPKIDVQVERVMVPMLTEQHLADLKAVAGQLQQIFAGARGMAEQLVEGRGELGAALQRIDQAIAQATKPAPSAMSRVGLAGAEQRVLRGDPLARKPEGLLVVDPPGSGEAVTLTSAQQAILNAAAFLESLGIAAPDVVQLALFAGQSAKGGYWRANIGRCRAAGLIVGTSLTPRGRSCAAPAAITTVEELHQHVFTNLLEGAQRQILRVLINCYPQALSAQELAEEAKLDASGGYWRANMGRLRSLGLITKRGPIAALPVLFLEGAA